MQPPLEPQQSQNLIELRIERPFLVGDVASDLDVIGRGQRRQQIIFLEHEADAGLAQSGTLSFSLISSRSRPSMWMLPEVGGVSPPRMWNGKSICLSR